MLYPPSMRYFFTVNLQFAPSAPGQLNQRDKTYTPSLAAPPSNILNDLLLISFILKTFIERLLSARHLRGGPLDQVQAQGVAGL